MVAAVRRTAKMMVPALSPAKWQSSADAMHKASAESFDVHQIDPGTVEAGPFLHLTRSPKAVLRSLAAMANAKTHDVTPTGVSALKAK
jgi:hypothetical protein